MNTPQRRELRQVVALRTMTDAGEMARQARDVGMDTVAYLLDMVAMEANRYLEEPSGQPVD